MSIYLGWHYRGFVKIYNESTDEITSHKISVGLSGFDEALDELLKIVKVANVKRLVFIHKNYGIGDCKSVVEKLTAKGFKSVYIQHWISNYLQTHLLKQNVDFTNGQTFLLAVDRKKAYFVVWCYRNGRIQFVKHGFAYSLIIEPNFNEKIVQLFDEFKLELMVSMKSTRTFAVVKNLFPTCKIVNQDVTWQKDEEAETALWTAKRQDGLVDGVDVGNCCWERIKSFIDDDLIFDGKVDGIPLPFNWISEWKIHDSALTASVIFDKYNCNLKLPSNKSCRIRVKIDRNGVDEMYVELKCILGISLSRNSFYLVRSSDSVDRKVISIGQFPTALRFDCDPPKLASSVSGESVIADAIEMLDPDEEEKNGWEYLRALDCDLEFCKKMKTETGSQVVSASFVIGELFDDIKSLVTDVSLDSENPICIALSRFLTQKQRKKLTNILKLKLPKNYFVDEIKAATFGFSVEKARPDGVTLVVDLKTTGCIFSLFQIEANFCELLVQQEFTDLKSENVRQAMQILYSSELSKIKPTSEFKAEMTEIIVKFRQAVSAVAGAEQMDVNSLLLIGSCHLVPKLEDFFAWSFFHADVAFLEESELCRFAAVGSLLLHFERQSLLYFGRFNPNMSLNY